MARSLLYLVAIAAGLAALPSTAARADDLRFGWALGASQSVQTVLTDSAQAFALIPALTGTAAVQQSTVQRFTGLVFNTGVTANTTFDVVGRQWDQGLILGVAFNQLVPTFLPADLAPNTAQASTAIQANAAYMARLTRPRWNLTLGGGFSFGLNGQIPIGADGGAGAAAGTLPGAQVGPVLVNGQTTTANARAALALNRARWDADVALDYLFSANGIYTLAAPGNAQATALGAFVPATTHTIGPNARARRRMGPFGTLIGNAGASWVQPVEVALEDDLIQNLLPETLTMTAGASYEHMYRGDENRWFVSLTSALNYRTPSDLAVGAGNQVLGRPLVDPSTGEAYGLQPDTLIYSGEVGLAGVFRKINLRYRIGLGLSQPRLYQPPLGGASPAFALYQDAVVGQLQPIGTLLLDRRFDPVDVNFMIGRQIAVGGLGASANISDTISLAARYDVSLWSALSTLSLNVGINGARNRSVGGDLVPPNPDANRDPQAAAIGDTLALLANGSDSLGLTVGAALPLFSQGGVRVDFDAAYAMTYNDPTAGLEAGQAVPGTLEAFMSHTIFATVRATWGRGPLETAGDADRTEENAFALNPSTGSPLVTARLLNLRAQSQERGVAPGVPSQDVRAGPKKGGDKVRKDATVGVGQSEGVRQVTQSSGAQLSVDAPAPAPARSDEPERKTRFLPPADEGPPSATPVLPIAPVPPGVVPPAPGATPAPTPAPSAPPAGAKKPAPDKAEPKAEPAPEGDADVEVD